MVARELPCIGRQVSKRGTSGALLTTQCELPLALLGWSLQPMGFKRVASMRDSERMQGKSTQRGKLPRDKVDGKGTLQEG